MSRKKLKKAIEAIIVSMSEERWLANKDQHVVELPPFVIDALWGLDNLDELSFVGVFITPFAQLEVVPSKGWVISIK